MKRLPSLAFAGLVLTQAPLALAQSGVEEHDGLQLSLGVGVAYSHTSIGLDPKPSGSKDASVAGLGVGAQILIGGTLAPGLVLGGGSMGGHFISPTLTVGEHEGDSDGDLAANLLGVYVDYYPDPRSGLHLLALVGGATLEDGNDATDGVAVGFGAAAGAGHQWWIGEQWSLGVLARLQLLRTTVDFPRALEGHYTTLIPAILATATYH